MSLWNWKRSGWVNLTLTIFLIIAVITSICSSGIRSGFQVLAPNFSFHGGLHPEIGFFNLLLICSAMFGFMTVALRYSYIMDQIQILPTSISYINKITALMGFISLFGLIMLASFSTSFIEKAQYFESMGAYIFIGVGAIFTMLQTVLTYSNSRYSLMFIIRLFLTIVLIASFMSSLVFMEKSKENSSNVQPSNSSNITTLSNRTKTESETSILYTREYLLIACILEWIAVIFYALFFLSFFREFQTISTYIIIRPFIVSPSNDFRSSSLTVNERI